jgi:hypothetical protein
VTKNGKERTKLVRALADGSCELTFHPLVMVKKYNENNV